VTASVAGPAEAGLRRTTLPNGLTVLSEYMPGVRSVAFGAWVRAASIHEPRERMGVSHLLEHMVFKGTERRSAKDIALSLEVLGGSLDAYTAREHTSFQARVLDEHLTEAADVIADLLFRPLLRHADLKLERKVVLEEISMVEDTPDDIVFELHNELLWGDHPYGYSILGTRDTVAALGVRDLRELHDRAYHPGQLVVAAAGNVEHDRLVETLGRTGWADASPRDAERLVSPPPVMAAPAFRHVERDSAQTHVAPRLAAAGHGGARVPPRGARQHADARRVRLSGGEARRPAPLRPGARQHDARRGHELAPLSARARGAGARLLGLHLPVVPRRHGRPRGVRGHGAGDGAGGDGRHP
jgi:predicted Zn-dependent peptidase